MINQIYSYLPFIVSSLCSFAVMLYYSWLRDREDEYSRIQHRRDINSIKRRGRKTRAKRAELFNAALERCNSASVDRPKTPALRIIRSQDAS